MLFVQYLFSSLNGPILAFKEEVGTLENISKVRESSNDGKHSKDERITGVGDRWAGQSAGLKYCSPGGLQEKWKQRLLLWSIAKCLPGICLFNPLSKAIWACNVDEQPAAHRKRWKMEAGYMWARHTHPRQRTTLLTCGNTCTNTTNENTNH